MKNIILILANNSDGLYGFRKDLLEEIEKTNKVHVAVPNDGYFEELKRIGCEMIETAVDRRGINPVKDVKLLLKYINIVKKLKPDKIITYTIKPNIYGGIVASIFKVPYVVNITGLGSAMQNYGIIRYLVKSMYKVALYSAKTVFFENAGNMKIFLDEKITIVDKCCLLNGAGVNLKKFSYHKYPSDNPTIKFLFIGRIMKEKGVDELFSAMRQLHEEGYPCVLNMLGHYEEDYKMLISKYINEGWLNYYGYHSDVRPFIEESHCFVLPSWHEGMANTNLECASMGRPVITSNIHGCMEAVEDGVSGFLCEPKDVESLVSAMKRFLMLSQEEKEKYGIRGRERMEQLFDKKKVVAETMERLFDD